MTEVSFDIIICGGGFGGLGCAIGLKSKGHNVTILEQTHSLNEVGAGIKVPPNSIKILKKYEVFDDLEKFVTKPKNIILRRFNTGEVLSKTPLCPDMTECYGNPYLLIHRADYQRVLYEKVISIGIEHKFGCRIATVDDDKVSETLENGDVYKGDIIIGAYGIKSKVRDASVVPEEKVLPFLSSNCAYRAVVPRDVMLSDPIIANLMEDVNSNCWIGYRRHVMTYPIRNGEMYNIVMSLPGQATLGKWNEPGNIEEMNNHYKNFHLIVRQLLSHIKTVLEWVLADMPMLPRWISKKW